MTPWNMAEYAVAWVPCFIGNNLAQDDLERGSIPLNSILYEVRSATLPYVNSHCSSLLIQRRLPGSQVVWGWPSPVPWHLARDRGLGKPPPPVGAIHQRALMGHPCLKEVLGAVLSLWLAYDPKQKHSQWLRWYRICLQCRGPRFDSWVGKIPWRRKWLPTPVFLPRESHGQRTLVGYSPWGRKESDMTEQQTTHTKQKGHLGMERHRLQVCESFCFQESSVSSHHSLF